MKSFGVRSIGGVILSALEDLPFFAVFCRPSLPPSRPPALSPSRSRFDVFPHAFSPTFAPETRLAIATKPRGGIEQVGRVHPHHARLDLGRDVEREVDVLRPHAGGQAVGRVV